MLATPVEGMEDFIEPPSTPRRRAPANQGRPNGTQGLIEIGRQAELFRTPGRTVFAWVNRGGSRENWPIDSDDFRGWLTHEFFRAANVVPGPENMKAALATLTAIAIYDRPEHEVFLRVAKVGSKIHVDLANEERTVIEIDAEG